VGIVRRCGCWNADLLGFAAPQHLRLLVVACTFVTSDVEEVAVAQAGIRSGLKSEQFFPALVPIILFFLLSVKKVLATMKAHRTAGHQLQLALCSIIGLLVNWSGEQNGLFTVDALVSGMGFGLTNNNNFDRFRAQCPVDDLSIISRFDPSLIVAKEQEGGGDDDDAAWVAVFRSNSNGPAVLARDDFFVSMDLAVSTAASKDEIGNSNSRGTDGASNSSIETRVTAQAPVAVARLRKSEVNDKQWVLDSIRCSLKKENTNEDCDGGSEHTEALSVCIDELMVHHLTKSPSRHFEQIIRCKATLVAAPLLETRGFEEMEELSRDMATHISSLNGALEKYAERASSVDSVVWKSPRTRDRTLQIVSLLGRLDQSDERQYDVGDNDTDSDNPDPWSSMKQYL
jgi:hypothetical protein